MPAHRSARPIADRSPARPPAGRPARPPESTVGPADPPAPPPLPSPEMHICRGHTLGVGRRRSPGYRRRKIFFPITILPLAPSAMSGRPPGRRGHRRRCIYLSSPGTLGGETRIPRVPQAENILPHHHPTPHPKVQCCTSAWREPRRGKVVGGPWRSSLRFGESVCAVLCRGKNIFRLPLACGALKGNASAVQDLPCNIGGGSGGSAIGAR